MGRWLEGESWDARRWGRSEVRGVVAMTEWKGPSFFLSGIPKMGWEAEGGRVSGNSKRRGLRDRVSCFLIKIGRAHV